MKNLKIPTLLLLSLSTSFIACKKGENPIPSPGSYTSFSNAYAEAAPKSKTVTINANAGGTFYGNSGTRYVFPANAFQTGTGALVSGNVDIEVLECTNEGDMIFGEMLTMSNDQILISGGEFNVKATQGTTSLYMRSGMNYEVHLPTNKGAATAGMTYFRGYSSTTTPGSNVNWLISMDTLGLTGPIVYNGDTITLNPDSLGFTNCDKYGSGDKALVDVKIDGISDTLAKGSIRAYYILDGLMSAISYNTAYGGTYSNSTFKSVNMVKLKAHIIVCTIYNGYFYGGILSNVTASNGSAYTVTIAKTTPTAFKAAINALN